MNSFLQILLGATVTVALLVAPAFSTGGDHDAMDMGEKPAMESMEDKAAMDLEKPMEGMDADAHDHEKVMEKAGVGVGIEEKLGNMLTDAEFLDSEGNSVNLLELTKDVPTILIPIYYRCPDVCNVLQGSFAQILPDVALKPGQEIQIISVSFDPREKPEDAARAKQTYLAATRGMYPAEHWKFLVGNKDSVNEWLDSIGYTVKREGGLYAHPVAVVAIAPGGKVVRYLYGSSFLPFDITMAGTEAAKGEPGLSIKRMLSMCYSYDPQGRRYVFDILRVSGFTIVGFIGLLVLYLVLSGKKEKKKKGS
ncbi:MAG: SCO family protein [Pseudodesulfovibrio sp.]